MPKNVSIPDRWWQKVDVRGLNECWPWKASRDQDGYGRFQEPKPTGGQRHIRAHRFGYEMLVGQIPAGLVVCHSCDTPPCCNPGHWFLGTNKDNNDDKVAKGRHAVPWGTPLTRSRATHCIHGHPFSGSNLHVDPSTGYRSCKTCRAASAMRHYWSKRSA